MATSQDLLNQMKKLEAGLEKAASTTAKDAPKGAYTVGANGSAWGSGGRYDWPIEKLKALADGYGCEAGVDMWAVRNGRAKLSGMGPALVKMAALASGQSAAIAMARSQGMKDGYTNDAFEEEHGFVQRAKGYRRYKDLNGEIRKAPLAEGTGATGGYTVPPQFMNELLTIAGEDGFIEQRAKVIPMNSRTATWPMLDITTVQSAGVTPYAGGIYAQWEQEAATINQTAPTFRQTEWTAWDLVMTTVSSNQLLADNGIGLDALLTQLFGWAMVWYKEYAFLRGLGAGNSMPLGVLNAPASILVQRTVPSTFRLADAANMMSRLHIRSWDDACWVMHQSLIPQLVQMVDNNVHNALVWMTPMGDGQGGAASKKLPRAFFNGLPIFFTEKVPTLGTTGDVMLIDWSRYVIGQRLDLQIDVSPHVLFQSNQLMWRVIARCDGKPWLNAPITDAAGWASTPFVVLRGS